MPRTPLTRSFALCAAMLLATLLLACPQRHAPDSPLEQNAASVPRIPLAKTPGLHLVYAVNDPRSVTFGVARSAHVLIAKPDGSRREILFDYSGFIFHAVPSPAGTHIAVVGSVWGESGQDERHLLLYDLASGSLTDVSATGFYSRAVQTPPIFTPDGNWVIFLSRWSVESGEFNIFECEVSSGQIRGLYTDPVEDVPLTMMPDGRRCIAVRRDPEAISVFEYISVDIETGAVTVLHRFENVTKVGPAHIDADENVIYCDIKTSEEGVGPFGGARSREVLSINLDDGTVRSLMEPFTVTYVYQTFTDADSHRRLLLRRQEDIEGEDTPMSRIALSSTDGADFQYLTDTSARSFLLRPPTNIPPIAPDNSLLFFYRQDPAFDFQDIWVMKLDGSDAVNISNTASRNEGSAGWIIIPEQPGP